MEDSGWLRAAVLGANDGIVSTASLLVGVPWALWHLPLLWTPGIQDTQLPWWLLGTSMVATTFSAETPLLISGWVYESGISRNWE